MQIIPKSPRQGSSAKVTANFKDSSNGSAVIPASVTYSLLTVDGTIVNDLDAVPISPASSIEIWLTGDDLQILDEANEYEIRDILIEATYNNGAAVVPLKDVGRFTVLNLTGSY